jgi:hypothetical protein
MIRNILPLAFPFKDYKRLTLATETGKLPTEIAPVAGLPTHIITTNPSNEIRAYNIDSTIRWYTPTQSPTDIIDNLGNTGSSPLPPTHNTQNNNTTTASHTNVSPEQETHQSLETPTATSKKRKQHENDSTPTDSDTSDDDSVPHLFRATQRKIPFHQRFPVQIRHDQYNEEFVQALANTHQISLELAKKHYYWQLFAKGHYIGSTIKSHNETLWPVHQRSNGAKIHTVTAETYPVTEEDRAAYAYKQAVQIIEYDPKTWTKSVYE